MTAPKSLPIEKTLEAGRQGDRREFWLAVVDGLPPVRAKRVLLEARGFGFLSDQDCTAFMDACGLGSV